MRIAEQVYKSGLNVDDINFYDMIEWVGEAIAKIGVPYAYIEKVTNGTTLMPDPIVIEDYMGVLPTDMVVVRGVRDHNSGVSLISEVGTFRSMAESNNLLNVNEPVMAAPHIVTGKQIGRAHV